MVGVRSAKRRWLILAAAVLAVSAVSAVLLAVRGAGAQEAVVQPAVRPPSAADLDVLHEAQQLLVRDCMAGQGFRYWPTARLPHAALRYFPYVVDDLAWAKGHGYGRDIKAALDRQDKVDPNTLYYGHLPADRKMAAAAALNGSSLSGLSVISPLGGEMSHSSSGCETKSWQQLYGNAGDWFQSSTVVLDLDTVRISQVHSSAAFQAAVRPWSECMRRAGYVAADPDALESARAADNGLAAAARDVKAATAEASCALSSRLSRMATRLDQQYGQQLFRQYRGSYELTWRLQVTALPAARRLVAAD
jgi:hypothetical protein